MSETRVLNNTRLPFFTAEGMIATIKPIAQMEQISNGSTCLNNAVGTFSNIAFGTKTKLNSVNEKLIIRNYKNGNLVNSKTIMPDIVDVKVIKENDNPKVVKVTFADDTVEKAVLDDNDTYSLEQGISICITKRILSGNNGNGSSIYNKLISYAMKVMKKNEKEAEQEADNIAAERERAKRIAVKKKLRAEKRAAKKKEEYIQAQAEAYLRAMKMIRELDKEDMNKALKEIDDTFKGILAEYVDEKASNETVTEINETTE